MAQSWRSQGRCRGTDPDIFYPAVEDEAAAREAKAICSTCPVRTPCLEHALAVREKFGVWGGLTERERRRALRQRRRTA
jgi:WhiB family redox-sensing transcriptional regulator